MLHFRDISLTKRILTTNFLMVFIPALLLFLAGLLLLGTLRLAGTARQNDLAALFPVQGPALSIQYALNELRYKADQHEAHVQAFEAPITILENAGISVVIAGQNGTLYATPGTNAAAMASQALPPDALTQPRAPMVGRGMHHHHGMPHNIMQNTPPMPEQERPQDDAAEQLLWTQNGLYFSYTSPMTGTTVRAAGDLPFLAQERLKQGPQKHLLEGLLLLTVGSAILLIVLLGVYLSRLLSRQILEPLAELRAASARVRAGDLDTPMPPTGKDEMGEACQDFDAMRAELQASRDQKAQYDARRKELIAGISHDLATPLTLLKGYADGLLTGLAATAEKRQQYVQRIYGAACTLERLVNNLRSFSRLEMGRMPLHPEPVDLSAYFADYTAETAPMLQERGLLITLQDTAENSRVNIDRDAFARVVDNILGNAIKYKKDAQVAMELSLRNAADRLQLTFADHGPGVPEAALPHLFELFYRTDAARTDTRQGSGLGLAICHEIITGLGGTIAASMTPGGGLTLTINLPLADASAAQKEGTL